jgi:hypothetical protein
MFNLHPDYTMSISPYSFVPFSTGASFAPPAIPIDSKLDGRTSHATPRVKTKHIVIDSRDRDKLAYPRPDSYEIKLPDDIENVTSIKLLVADIPFSRFDVDGRNSTFKLDGVLVDIPHGDYASLDALASAATSVMVSHRADVKMEYDARADAFVISSTSNAFQVDFASKCSSGAILGYGEDVYESSLIDGVHVVRPPFRRTPCADRYLILSLKPNAEVLTSSNNATHREFAIIPNPSLPLPDCDSDLRYEKTWSVPLARLSRIKIQIIDYDGRPYDFRNANHRVEFLITHQSERAFAM